MMLLLVASGCGLGSSGYVKSPIILGSEDFTVVKTNLTSVASTIYVLNVVPTGSEKLYKRAMEELKKQLPDTSHSLINITSDYTVTSYVVYSIHKVTLTADLIKFGKVVAPPPSESTDKKEKDKSKEDEEKKIEKKKKRKPRRRK